MCGPQYRQMAVGGVCRRRPICKDWAFAVVRHCERADKFMALVDGKPWTETADFMSYPFDPPLSDAGLKGAQVVASRLRDFVDNGKTSNKHLVICSPYWRCVQTGATVAAQLTNAELVLDNALAEAHGPQTLSVQTEPEVLLRPVRHAVEYCEALGVQCRQKLAGKTIAWPESMISAQERYATALMSILSQAKMSGTSVIIVTHGLGVFTSMAMMPSHVASRIEKVEHGGMFIARGSRSEKRAHTLQERRVSLTTDRPEVLHHSQTHKTLKTSLLDEDSDLGRSGYVRASCEWQLKVKDIKVKRFTRVRDVEGARHLKGFLHQCGIPISAYEELLGQLACSHHQGSRVRARSEEAQQHEFKCRSASMLGLPNDLASLASEDQAIDQREPVVVLRELRCSEPVINTAQLSMNHNMHSDSEEGAVPNAVKPICFNGSALFQRRQRRVGQGGDSP